MFSISAGADPHRLRSRRRYGRRPAPTPDLTPEPDFTVGELYKLPDTSYCLVGCNTGDAYYEIAGLWPKQGGSVILKTDYETGVQSCVCQIPGCTHDSSDCPAYLPILSYTQVFVVEGAVYLSYNARPVELRPTPAPQQEADAEIQPYTEEDLGEMSEEEYRDWRIEEVEMMTQPSFVDVISPDGLTRRRVATIPDELSYYPQLRWCDGRALYGACYLGGSYIEKSGVLLRVDLTTGRTVTLPLGEQEELVGAVGRELLICQIVTATPLPKESGEAYNAIMQNSTIRFDLVDFATGARRTVTERPFRDCNNVRGGLVCVCGREFFFRSYDSSENIFDQKSSRLEAFDADTGAVRVVLDSLSTLGGVE